MNVATLVRDPPRAGQVTTTFLLGRGLPIRGIDNVGHLGDQTPILVRAWMPPLNQASRSRTFSVTMLSASASRPMGPLERSPCRWAPPGSTPRAPIVAY